MKARSVLTLLLAAQAGAVTVTPGPDAPRPIRPDTVSGFNLGNWMPVVEALPQLRALDTALLRWPGGNVGDENDLTPAGLQTLKTNWTLLGEPALIVQTRVFTRAGVGKASPADAAQAVRDARDKGLRVAYWEIGNEPNLYATNRSDPSWTPEKYCATVRAQRAAILAVDPAARIAGPAVSNPGEYLNEVIRRCGDALDLVTWHLYPTDGSAAPAAALASAEQATTSAEQVRALWADPATNPLGHLKPLNMAVTEYGLSWRTNKGRHLSDAVGGLWAAEATLRFSAAGASTAYFALMGTGNHGLLDEAGFPRFAYGTFHELAHYRGQTFSVQSDDPRVWVHAAQQGAVVTLFALNTADSTLPLTATLPGLSLIGAKAVTDEDVNADRPPRALNIRGPVALPPLSLTRLVFKAQP
ncbi:hypothetical protein K7W42_04280 [Deinococcus sp. HMF7604]|uniref:hypothetical protein n=1 Tax=Deinococcus betulae TaxID=2873312 RepID=UPI001CCA39F4|nr:hypothetical protein [Deinococcus betulae]MBZ9750076.1 hypothetical protein [Deinococcus betulae]